jgi:hypothetical protein
VPSRPTAEVQVSFINRVAGFGIRRRSTADETTNRHAQAGRTTAIKQAAGKNGVQVKKVKRVAHACPTSGSVRKTRPVHNRRCPSAGGPGAHSASGPLRRSRSTRERMTPRGYILAPELTDHGRPHRTPWADCCTESHPVPVINRDRTPQSLLYKESPRPPGILSSCHRSHEVRFFAAVPRLLPSELTGRCPFWTPSARFLN